MPLRRSILVLVVCCVWAQSASAQDHWVTTWAAAPQPFFAGFRPGADTQPPSFKDQTIRMIVRTSLGGTRARVTLTNAHGHTPLDIGAAHVALRRAQSAIVAGSDRRLTFNGRPSVVIPPGAQMLSDPVDVNVPQLGDVVISLHIAGETKQPTMHFTGLHTTYIAKGAAVAQPMFDEATTMPSYYFLSSLEIRAPLEAGTIVAFGDSITDGATSTNDANASYPGVLAARIATTSGAPKLTVVNQGISGNRLLIDGVGANALARFDRDVLGMSSVKWLILLEGINDIGRSTGPGGDGAPAAPVTADDLIGALKQIVDRAHAHGIKVVGCTLTPYEGAAYYSDAGENIRQAVNRWIRTAGAFDVVVDFDKVTQDPANPKALRPAFNNGDKLHPNDAGYKAMAEAVGLEIFNEQPVRRSPATVRGRP